MRNQEQHNNTKPRLGLERKTPHTFFCFVFVTGTDRTHVEQVAEGMDFKGKPARNVALVNATIDGIPFLKVVCARFSFFCDSQDLIWVRIEGCQTNTVACRTLFFIYMCVLC